MDDTITGGGADSICMVDDDTVRPAERCALAEASGGTVELGLGDGVEETVGGAMSADDPEQTDAAQPG